MVYLSLVIPALGRLRCEDFKFELSLGYIIAISRLGHITRPCLKKPKQKMSLVK
jgi:hypothetical protein